MRTLTCAALTPRQKAKRRPRFPRTMHPLHLAVVVAFASSSAAASLPTTAGVTSNYCRPRSTPLLAARELEAVAANRECPPATGGARCSQQVHVQLGGPGEMVVSYASASAATPAEVSWGATAGDLAWLAIGTKASYSQLLVFTKYNALPDMGGPQPGASLAEQLGRQDTSSWAIDPLTHEPGNSYVFV